MKKVVFSLLLLGATSLAAHASSKTERHHPIRIDHSKDIAYSAAWAQDARPPAADAHFNLGDDYIMGPYHKGTLLYFGLHNVTVHSAVASAMRAPYLGQPAPSWDGPAKNEYRNMRAYRTDPRLFPTRAIGRREGQ